MTFEIVKIEKYGKFRFVLTIFVILSLILMLFSLFGNLKLFYSLLASTVMIVFIIIFDKLKYSKIGKINISENEFSLNLDGNCNHYNLDEFSSLHISHKQFYPNGSIIGANSILKLTFQKPETKFSFWIYLRNKNEKIKFVELLKRLYKTNIEIRETNEKGERTFLFRSNLTYNKIKEIKDNYRINWF